MRFAPRFVPVFQLDGLRAGDWTVSSPRLSRLYDAVSSCIGADAEPNDEPYVEPNDEPYVFSNFYYNFWLIFDNL